MGTYVSLQWVYEWHGKFKSGMSYLADTGCCSWPNTANRPDVNAEMEEKIWKNCQVKIIEVSRELKTKHA